MDRIIMHVDMNSYFASVEQQANPFLRGKPVGVIGRRTERTIVVAASREAKRMGARVPMSIWKARETVPSMILVPGDPEKYRDINRRFNAVFREITERVEPFGIDESFLDVTDAARDYLGATLIAQTVKRRLREECGEWITASIGVAPNKPMAKLASDSMKPDGLVVVPPDRVRSLLDRSKPGDLCGIGRKTEARLDQFGIRTLAQLRAYPLAELERAFKSYGTWLHEIAHGRGDDRVASDARDQKSYGHSHTLPQDTADLSVLRRELLVQCDKVAWRMRRDGFAARSVSMRVRYGNFRGEGRQSRSSEAMDDGLRIFETAWRMLEPLVAESPVPVRLVGVSVSDLLPTRTSRSLFEKERKLDSVLAALDSLQRRYGDRAWTRASLIGASASGQSGWVRQGD